MLYKWRVSEYQGSAARFHFQGEQTQLMAGTPGLKPTHNDIDTTWRLPIKYSTEHIPQSCTPN